MLIIWNTCYLECLVFGILSYTTSFTGFTHYIYTTDISSLRRINQLSFHPTRTSNSSTNGDGRSAKLPWAAATAVLILSLPNNLTRLSAANATRGDTAQCDCILSQIDFFF